MNTPRLAACLVLPLSLLPLGSCSSAVTAASSTTSTGNSTTSTTNTYAAAYQAVTWASGVTVAFTSNCSMTVTSSGIPPFHNTYYLTPATGSQTVVATTASGIQLAVAAYATSGISTVNKVSATFNICPTKATSTTATSNGPIGIMTSGEAIFDPYEATGVVAMADNASYTFTSGGVSYTASFIDQCNSHAAGGMGANSGSTWHYHAVPTCWTTTVDGATGPSHIIGIALDGFPIYGGRDVNGSIVDPTTLDACNGITSATPEFPSGAYHYVLPITSSGAAITTKQSSLTCYAGTVNSTVVATMKKFGCNMPFLLADGNARLPDGREVTRAEAAAWLTDMKKQMAGMQMATDKMMPDDMPHHNAMHHSSE
ncbi:YHYH protein [Bryocella elongata]|nr:YHYH protein [Bryocella elongata]